MTVAGSVRPRLREDCWYAPIDGGLYVQTSTDRMRLEGAGLHPLLSRLAPHLDGAQSVDTLTAGLRPAQAAVVRRLLDLLLARGIVRDAAGEREHTLTAWELDRYGQEIALADRLVGSGAFHFERFRRSTVLVVGAGDLLTATVRTLLRLGLRSPSVAITAEVPTDRAGYAVGPDPAQQVTTVDDLDLDLDPGRVTDRLAGIDAVLDCSDRPMLGRAARLALAGRAAGVPVLHAIPVGGAAWIGPTDGGIGGGCFACAWRRLRGTVAREDPGWPELALVDRPGAAPEEHLTGPLTGMVAAILGLAYFRLAIGAEQPAGHRITRIELATALTGEHRYHPHPACEACRPAGRGPVAVRVAGLSTHPPTTTEELSRGGAELVDSRVGLLTELSERDLPQLPLSMVAASVADPADSGAGVAMVIAAAPDRARARRRAVVRALELAASRLAGSAPDDAPLWDPLAGTTGGPVRGECRRAVAAGFSWAEAVGRALLLLHSRDPIFTGDGPGGGWGPIGSDWDGAELLTDGLRAYQRLGEVAEASVRRGEELVSRAWALDVRVAAAAAIEAAVAAGTGHPDAGFAVAPDLGDTAWAERLDPLLRRLAGAGWRVLVAPVDGCPAVSAALPFMAAVTVGRVPAGSEGVR
jgi:bacteriocin biosynthesis cyclodehydratase domain-containing protein